MANKVLLVTGGGSGIGRAVVLKAAQRGFSVGVLDRNAESAAAVAEEAASQGARKSVGLVCDVTSESSVISAFNDAEDQLGPLSGLFTSAGIERSGVRP